MSARSILLSWLAAATLVVLAGTAAAEKPNPAFAGRIMLSDKRFPTSARSLAAFNAQVKKQSKLSFAEDKERKAWKIHFASFLRQPLNDVEYMIKIYEMTGRGQQLLLTFEQFTDERGQAALISNMTLERKQIGVNKELMMTVESRGKVLASSRFKLLGQSDRFTGKVDFSEEEAAGAVKDEE